MDGQSSSRASPPHVQFGIAKTSLQMACLTAGSTNSKTILRQVIVRRQAATMCGIHRISQNPTWSVAWGQGLLATRPLVLVDFWRCGNREYCEITMSFDENLYWRDLGKTGTCCGSPFMMKIVLMRWSMLTRLLLINRDTAICTFRRLPRQF